MKALTNVVFACLLLFSTGSKAQLAVSSEDGAIVFSKDTVAQFTSFTATINENIVYLKWTITNLKQSGAFAVYRSADGKNFDLIGTTPATGVTVAYDIAYYFTDSAPLLSKASYYKLVFIGTNKTFLAGDKISVASNLLPVAFK